MVFFKIWSRLLHWNPCVVSVSENGSVTVQRLHCILLFLVQFINYDHIKSEEEKKWPKVQNHLNYTTRFKKKKCFIEYHLFKKLKLQIIQHAKEPSGFTAIHCKLKINIKWRIQNRNEESAWWPTGELNSNFVKGTLQNC